MEIVPVTNKTTKKDIAQIKAMGYQISKNNKQGLDTFLNNTFPNLNILKILITLEQCFTHTTQKTIVRNILFDESSEVLVIDYNNDTYDEDEAAVFVREFKKIKSSIEVEHKYCILPKEFRGKGLIKPVFQESLQQYINSNVKKIIVIAGLSNGGYTWAKHGFRATEKIDMDIILKNAKHQLKPTEFTVVEKIYLGYYAKYPNGKSFPINAWATLDFMKPILIGSVWNGELNLKNKRHLNKYSEYVYR